MDKLNARLDNAICDLYHNATIHFPNSIDDPDGSLFDMVLEEGQNEIRYISEGLGYSKKEWSKQERLGFTHNERFYWLVSRITEFGKLYQYGRGGRTLAPDGLVSSHGGSSFVLTTKKIGQTKAEVTDAIQIIEAFNQYINEWCSVKNIRVIIEDSLCNGEHDSIQELFDCNDCTKLLDKCNG